MSSDGKVEDSYSERVYWSPDLTRIVGVRTRAGEDYKIHMVESSPKDSGATEASHAGDRKPGDRVPVAKPQLFDVIAQRQIPVSDDSFANPERERCSMGLRIVAVHVPFQPAWTSGASHRRPREERRGETHRGGNQRDLHRLQRQLFTEYLDDGRNSSG